MHADCSSQVSAQVHNLALLVQGINCVVDNQWLGVWVLNGHTKCCYQAMPIGNLQNFLITITLCMEAAF